MKYYITTPIYYVNDKPHIGHVYSNIISDILARYNRILGKEVYFLTGTDENSQKNTEAAEKAGKGDNIQGFLDEMAAVWSTTFDSLNLSHNRFIRTTEEDHKKAVEKFWKAVEAKGDIYKGEYAGLYCKGCEAFITETDLQEGKCPTHQKEPEKIKEENYFFKLTKYRDDLLEHIGKHPEFIQPVSRRNEITNYIRDFMTDISITRQFAKCGIPVPGDDQHRIYVWFDALINYLTGVGYGVDEQAFGKYWPADLHVVGKDIIKFHCALWPAMLMAADLPLPKQVFAHGFFTINGEKISKSLNNAINPLEITEKYNNDVLRYFLIREIKLGEDGDFSEKRIEERYAGDLANEFGNLVQRVLTMDEKYFNGKIPEKADGFLSGAWPAYQSAMDENRLNDALDIIWSLMRQSNQFIEEKQPWQLAKLDEKEMLSDVIYILLETLRHIAWMVYPFMPETAEQLFIKLGLELPKEFSSSVQEAWVWGKLIPGGKIKKGEALFPRLK